MAVTAADVKALRERTGAPIVDVKNALEEAAGDEAKAIEILRKKGQASAAKRSGRGTSEGVVESYIHADARKGALVEVQCETDFVARNEDFKEFARQVAIHITAMNPEHVSFDDIPEEERRARTRRSSRRRRRRTASPTTSSQRSSTASYRSGPPRSCCSTRSTSTRSATRARPSRTCAPRSPRRPARTCASRASPASRWGRSRYPVASARFNRILLKLSGEALMGDLDYGTDPEQIERIATQVREVRVQEVEVAIVVGRREHLPRPRGGSGGHGPRDRRLHGDAGDGPQCAHPPGRAREGRRRHPGPLCDGGHRGRRALHPPPRDPPPREGPRRDLRRRHRQPVLHHGHRRGPAGARDPC